MNADQIKAIRNRVRTANAKGEAMHSACGEYDCECHGEILAVLDALEAAERSRYILLAELRSLTDRVEAAGWHKSETWTARAAIAQESHRG